MNLNIVGLHMKVGESLTNHVEQKLEGLGKYFSGDIEADVQFSQGKEASEDVAIGMHVHGLHLRAVGTGVDCYLATDDAVAKLERQLQKYKGRMQKHRRRREDDAVMAQVPVFQATHNFMREDSLEEAPEDLFAECQPEIERRAVKEIKSLTVDEAVMQMDLLHTNIFVFQNVKTRELNVVYREHDGSICWVEAATPGKQASAA